MRKFLAACALIVACVIAGLVLLRAPEPARPPFPKPKCYDDIQKSARLLTGVPNDPLTLSRDDLRAFLAANAEPLRLARQGLGQRCQVTLEYSDVYLTNRLNDLGNLKLLA